MNKKNRILFVTFVITAAAGVAISASHCFSAPDKAPSPARTKLPADPARMAIVTKYINKTRGWSKDQYMVSLRHKDGNLWHFWVYFNGARKPGVVGNDGKSFDAVLNIDTNRVEKELHFQ